MRRSGSEDPTHGNSAGIEKKAYQKSPVLHVCMKTHLTMARVSTAIDEDVQRAQNKSTHNVE